MKIFIFEKYKTNDSEYKGMMLTNYYIRNAVKKCGYEGFDVVRTDLGKPIIKFSIPCKKEVFVSASHSGDYFVCAVDENYPVGIDVQITRKTDYNRLSRRFFSDDEKAYVEKTGEHGFFTLWTRKEAYSKITGMGIEDIMKKIPVINRSDAFFYDFQIEEGVYCSCCMKMK